MSTSYCISPPCKGWDEGEGSRPAVRMTTLPLPVGPSVLHPCGEGSR
jgi:hypothetical protein